MMKKQIILYQHMLIRQQLTAHKIQSCAITIQAGGY